MKNLTVNIQLCSLILSASFFIPTANAVEGLSGNVGVTSNYLWRGLEQTNGKAAVSGGLDFSSASGFYAGTWVSNADWSEGMTYELDLYGGFSGEMGNVGYDFGVISYMYPDSMDDVDFTEVNMNISFGVFSLGYAVLANAEGYDFGDDSYISADLSFDLASDINLAFHLGKGTDDFYAGEEFTDYNVSLSKSGFTIGLSKTDLDGDDMRAFVSYAVDIDM